MHILVVDSNPGVLIVAKKVLSRAGFEVITAGTVQEGIARAARHVPDVLLLDGAMATSGVILEFAWATSRRMPILLMIQKGHEDALRQALRMGRWESLADVVTILEKPLAAETLMQAIRHVLEPLKRASQKERNLAEPVMRAGPVPPASTAAQRTCAASLIPAELVDSDADATQAGEQAASEDRDSTFGARAEPRNGALSVAEPRNGALSVAEPRNGALSVASCRKPPKVAPPEDEDMTAPEGQQLDPNDVLVEPILPTPNRSTDISDDAMYAAAAEMPEGVRIVDLAAFQTHVLGTRGASHEGGSGPARNYGGAQEVRRESARVPPTPSRAPIGTFAALLAESQRPGPTARTPLPPLDSPWTDIAPYHDRETPVDPAAETAAALLIELSDIIDHPAPDLEVEDLNAFPTLVGPIPRPAVAAARETGANDAVTSAITDPPASDFPPLSGEIVISGRSGGIRVEQVLQLAAEASGPTCVRLEMGPSAIDIFFEESKVAWARRHQPTDRDALDLWIDERLPHPRTGDEGEEPTAAERQAELAIYEVVRWNDCQFTITENEPMPESARSERMRLGLMPLILEGARRLDEWRKIAGELSSRSAVPGRVPRSDEARILSSLSPDQRRLLEEVDGHRSVEEIVKSVKRPPLDVLRALRRLHDERLVTLVEKSGSA